MQTFLPYPDFVAWARVLDVKRLGKQRVETIQVVRALTWPDYGWANHPAVLMWKGFEEALGRKDPEHYRPLFPDVPDDLPYVWPVRSEAAIEAEQRTAEAAVRREERAQRRRIEEAERRRRRRSRAAKKAWRTRRADTRGQRHPEGGV